MRDPYSYLLVFLLVISSMLAGAAQTASAAGDRSTQNVSSEGSTVSGVLTGKERLGRKWMDEQRIDNCKVPFDKRGTKPRPGNCPHGPEG